MHVNIGGQSLGKVSIDTNAAIGSQVKLSIEGVHNGSAQSPVMIHRVPAPRNNGIRAIGRGVKVTIGKDPVDDVTPDAIQAIPGTSEFPVIALGNRPKVKIVFGPVDDEGNPVAEKVETLPAPQEPVSPFI